MKKAPEKSHLNSNLSFSSSYKYNGAIPNTDGFNGTLSIDKKSHKNPLVYSDLDLKQNLSPNKNSKDPLKETEKELEDQDGKADKPIKARWHSFEKKKQIEASSPGSISMNSMTAAEMTHLKSVAILRLSTLLNYNNDSITNTRRIPKIFRRLFSTDAKSKSSKIKLSSFLQKYGQPFPPIIISIIAYLKINGVSCSGIFRKSGRKANIILLEEKFAKEVTEIDLSKFSCYDLADSLKSYIRKMPAPLIPPKIASIILSLHTIPEDKKLFVTQVAMLLIPDENRDAFYMLLDCLHVISGNSRANLMTSENLAICLAPSIFHLSPAPLDKDRSYTFDVFNFSRFSCYASTVNTAELCPTNSSYSCEFVTKGSIYSLAQQGITYLINNFNCLFVIPYELHAVSRLTVFQSGNPMRLEDFCKIDTKSKDSYDTYMTINIEEFYEEHRNKYKAWSSLGTINGVHISYRKVKDGYPLKLYRGTIDLNVLCTEAFNCYLYKGSLWSGNTQRFVIKPLSTNSDLFYQRYYSSTEYFNRDFTLLRKWRKINDTYIMAANSIEICENDLKDCNLQTHQYNKILGRRVSPRATLLGSRFVVEPSQGKTRVNLIMRVDLKGKRASTYKYLTPFMISQELNSLRDYFAPSTHHISEAIV